MKNAKMTAVEPCNLKLFRTSVARRPMMKWCVVCHRQWKNEAKVDEHLNPREVSFIDDVIFDSKELALDWIELLVNCAISKTRISGGKCNVEFIVLGNGVRTVIVETPECRYSYSPQFILESYDEIVKKEVAQ